MEATAGVAAGSGAGRNVSLPMSSLRKEWRVVSEHHSVRNVGDEELDGSKIGQSDERTIYEVQQGREPVDVDFCSITIDGGLDNNILEQRVHSVARQREELQQLEVELRAQLIARSEIIEMQHGFDAQIEEHANANIKLQEQLHERERAMHEMERKLEEKDRELHAIKLDNEAAWAKEDLLRQQNKELATFRRERDNSEAERSQNLQQIHDLQEHIQDKERQFLELQEQQRVAQDAIIFKDEQLREAQAWIARAQEVDAMHSTTNHSLQAELRERGEQYNQLWMGCQRQFAEMERLHLHTIQQLQLEIADARERSGAYTDEARASQPNLKDASHFEQKNGSQVDVNGSDTSSGNHGVLPNGTADNGPSFVSSGNASTQTDHVPGVPIAPSSLLGMPTYLPPGQVTALHPYVMHQQGATHSIQAHVPQSHVGHFHSIPAISSLQHWQNQQAVSEGSQISSQDQFPPPQSDQNLLRSDVDYNYEISMNGQVLQTDYLNAHISQGVQPDSVIPSTADESQVLETVDNGYLVASQTQQSLQQISSQFHDALKLDHIEQNSETKVQEKNVATLTNHGVEGQALTSEQPSLLANISPSDDSMHSVLFSETTVNNTTGAVLPGVFLSSVQTNTTMAGKTLETSLLDERSLLACIVRTIPPGGRVRISSTLPNRLGKMLAPLHWHDYKKKYGKLDDFVSSHAELFVIEGDYIQLREGAQEMIAATAAVAKVAAAAAALSPFSSFLPSVAVTPMAQPYRLKKIPDVKAADRTVSNGVYLHDAGGISNVKILSKSKDSLVLNGPESRPGQPSVHSTVGHGANPDRPGIGNNQNKGSANMRGSSNFVGKQHSRTSGVVSTSRR